MYFVSDHLFEFVRNGSGSNDLFNFYCGNHGGDSQYKISNESFVKVLQSQL